MTETQARRKLKEAGYSLRKERGGAGYMIGHTDRYVRVAVKEGTEAYSGAKSGEITSVVPSGMLNDETLLV